METILYIAIKSPTPAHTEKLLWMLGDDAPLFDDEVEPKWRGMFNAIEDMFPPEDILKVNNEYLVMHWLCGNVDGVIADYSGLLSKAGFAQQAVYYSADEDSGFIKVKGKKLTSAKPKNSKKISEIVPALPTSWSGDGMKHLIERLISVIA